MKREVEVAMNKEIVGKRIVVLPLLYRTCEIPIFLSDKLYADFTTSDKFIPSLNLIKSRLGLPLTLTVLPADESTENLLHQVRTPLRLALARLSRVEVDEDAVKSLRLQLASVSSLIRNSELVLSRFRVLHAYSKGQYALRLIPKQDVLEIVRDIITYASVRLDPSSNIRVVVDAGAHPKASLDREFFEIAVSNLLDNALKYSCSNSTVRIKCSQDDSSVHIHFFNTGLPIDEVNREMIFEQGFRGRHAMSVTGGGAGVGLYLARQIMMSHGGAVEYRKRNNPEEHEFILSLPKQYSPDAA